MKIMFLGRPGAGKTSLIAFGFADLAGRTGARTALADRQRLAWIRRAAGRGRPPARTRGVRTRRAVLPGGGHLDCVDHDGRLVDGTAADVRLLRELGSADALVLVVDATSLLPAGTAAGLVSRLMVAVRRRVHALETSAQPYRLPVVLAVTHTDRLPAGTELDAITIPFEPLLAVAGDGRVAGLTVPVTANTTTDCAVPLLWCLRHVQPDPAVPKALPVPLPESARPWKRPARRPQPSGTGP